MTATWKFSGVQHEIDYDSDQDQDSQKPGRVVVTRCGLTGWAARGWQFTRIRKSKDGDKPCQRCFR